MDLCGPMRVESINVKWYVLVIVDDYSRYTWVHFLRSKDKAPEVIIKFFKQIQVLLQAPVITTSTVRNPQKNGADVVAIACYTQNRSLIHKRFNKTPYNLINNTLPDISFLHVFEALCYPRNDREDIGNLGAKVDISFFIGYSFTSCAYRVYNRRTKKVMEIMNVTFDELSAMAFEQRSLKPELQARTSGHISSGLDPTYALSTITSQKPTEHDLELLFEAMYDDYMGGQQSYATKTAPALPTTLNNQTLNASTTTVETTLRPTNSSTKAPATPNSSQDVDEVQQQHFQQ
ncbi:retrovirus-related pol polyprotein from transposon TNT 1-94 [Tanacetum coccineum]